MEGYAEGGGLAGLLLHGGGGVCGVVDCMDKNGIESTCM